MDTAGRLNGSMRPRSVIAEKAEQEPGGNPANRMASMRPSWDQPKLGNLVLGHHTDANTGTLAGKP